jgi:cobalt-zinc-cadmium efflux system outer membrane protein
MIGAPARWPALAVAVSLTGLGGAARAEGLTMPEAVAIALQRNRDVIAAKLEIEGAELDVVAARIYPNPQFSYALGNLVLGVANPQNAGLPPPPPPVTSGFLGQPVQSFGVSELIDVWAKRSARVRAADLGVDRRRFLTEDALRDIVYGVRSAYDDLVREQSEDQLAHEVSDRYAQTIRLSQSRFRAGDISEADLRKIELEGLKYANDVIDADMELDVARGKLAALLSLPSGRDLPGGKAAEPEGERPTFDIQHLVANALEHRPDLRAAGAARTQAEAAIDAAKREVYPDLTLGAAYTHSDFTVSGDNPNTLAFSLSLPLPLFDRNQANIGRARLDLRRAENDGERLRIAVMRDVTEAVRKADRSATLLAVFEKPAGGAVPGTPTGTHDTGGMIERAETALKVAEKSYRAGAISLIELLEAQRTYLDTRAQYLRALHDFRQAAVDVTHAVGEPR